MKSILDIKTFSDDLEIEYEVLSSIDINKSEDSRRKLIDLELLDVDEKLTLIEDKIAELNTDIERLTNHADGIDNMIAVASGILTGIIDSTIVGEWNFAEAKKDAHKDINSKVVNFAKKQPDYIPWTQKRGKDPDRLETAIKFLETKFHLPGDGDYSSGNFGIGGNTHRLDDFCHHPTIIGLLCCVIVQFTGHTMYVNKKGESINIPITVNDYGNFVGNNVVTKIFSGIINWFITCAKTIANRKGHLMSDIATSASLPGTFLSIITELASIPCFRNKDFLKSLRNAYMNGIGEGKNQVNLGAFNVLFEGAQNKLDVVTEKAVMNELKRQSIPVVINEILVRASYFIRRFILELKEKKDINSLEWKKIIPFNNRTIVRMMTIATGTFTTIDLADAGIRAVIKSGGFNPETLRNFILRVNFVGVGRFAIAVVTDIGMGVSNAKKRNERIKLRTEQLKLLDSKVYYKQAGMWIAAESTEETLNQAYNVMEHTAEVFLNAVNDINTSLNNIGEVSKSIEEKNPGLINDLSEIIEWG